jgi:hypothetical protein
MFPEHQRDCAPFVAFAAWIDEEIVRYRAQRRLWQVEASQV